MVQVNNEVNIDFIQVFGEVSSSITFSIIIQKVILMNVDIEIMIQKEGKVYVVNYE